MPAMLDDPDSPTIYRTSGSAPFSDPHSAYSALPLDVYPRQVTLRDRVTTATIVPFSSRQDVPASLLAYLRDQLNKEIELGDTYPMIDSMPLDKFSSYWFQNFGAVMLLGTIDSASEVTEGKIWATECLGSFYIKPNYPGRSSHVCNAGFLVTDAARNRGVGRLMGEAYLDWAPKLGYTYSVFNLVYETNVASCKIWDALGFKRIGRVKGAGNLKSYPDQLTDAIIFGRDLGQDGTDIVSEERFDKIAFYLRYGKYPVGADRAEKSRLRSAATHYKLLESGKLMLKDKEVISDPAKQYEIARDVHIQQHGGINKTTATIAEKYHWVRIKETVSLVIKNCTECKELGKAPTVRADGVSANIKRSGVQPNVLSGQNGVSAAGCALSMLQTSHPADSTHPDLSNSALRHSEMGTVDWKDDHQHHTSVSPQVLNRSLPGHNDHSHLSSVGSTHRSSQHDDPHPHQRNLQNDYMPLDPQIMEDVRQHLGSYNSTSHSQNSAHSHQHTPIFGHLDELHDSEDAFHILHTAVSEDAAAGLDMLLDHPDDDDDADVNESERIAELARNKSSTNTSEETLGRNTRPSERNQFEKKMRYK
ncbi:hypothetical protein BJ878DRAFT_177013 [Calycina marina]|uniref:N-acetyltransferase domain-containing protein n=1 Tax=Calycina marina TaxID=1763456 RepID=A0A9P7Z8T8_9HELO|nr:hypothetical protein BJ878DRAFT_177013 [Calycina marina]